MTTANKSIFKTLNLSSTTQFQDTEDDFKTGYALVIISVAILIGNSLVLLTVKSFARRLVADVLISSLALLDIVHTVTSILLAIIFKWTSLHHNKSRESKFQILCQIQAWFTVSTQVQSAFIVSLINLERLIAVSRPFFYKSSVDARRAVKILLILLFISICISSLPLIGWGNYELLPKLALCLFPHDSEYAIFIVAIGYADLLVVSYCFFAIKISLKKFMKRQAQFAARRGAIVELQSQGVDPALKITKTASKSIKQSQRLLKVTAMVSGLFYFSWLPLMIAITRAQVTHKTNDVLSLMATLQPLSSPLVNPLIYFFTWERYRKSYIKIVKRIMNCLVKTDNTTIIDEASRPAIRRSTENLNQNHHAEDDEDNAKKEFEQLNKRSLQTNQEIFHTINLPMISGKLRSYSYDNTMALRYRTSSIPVPCKCTETKRRNTIGEISRKVVEERESLSEKSKQGVRHNSEESLSGFKDKAMNCNSSRDHKNSLTISKMKRNSRKLSKLWFKTSQESIVNHQNENMRDGCFKVNQCENTMEHYDVSVKDRGILKNHVPHSSVTGTTGHDNENLSKCLITQRISQYLKNVVNEREPQNTQKVSNDSGIQQDNTNSQKIYENSASKYPDRRMVSRQRPKQLYFKNKVKYSRKYYSEEFEDFCKQLENDKKLGKRKKRKHLQQDTASEKFEDPLYFQKCVDREVTVTEENRSDICDKEKNITSKNHSDQLVFRTLPTIHTKATKNRTSRPFPQKYLHHGNRSTGSDRKVFLRDALRRGNSKKQRGLQRDTVSKSKETAASIWSYL